ncbi:MAG: DNA polymerase [Christensenellales bacterium]|jgi:hypothetical protein
MTNQDMFVDLETYSSVDLTKSGLYKYVQAPDFTILLLGYAFGDGAVQVIDLTEEPLPAKIKDALLDPAYTKHAYNAAFEWQCLAQYLAILDPVGWLPQWRDTLLQVAYCGYPGSLDAAGEALGLMDDQRKDRTGKALIRYFSVPCKPTKANGGRTRNLPKHAPDKWALYKAYNAQDVVTERAVAAKLAAHPVPDDLQAQWVTDLTINARGVAVDMDLVRGALDCSERVKRALTQEAAALTGLGNPNSVAQLTAWLAEATQADVDNLRKDTVTDLLAGDLPGDQARRVLQIRQELGKTSTRKYDAMARATCEDGRIRGTLQFYGANRTGRWCLSGDHEVLTPTGWVRLDQWQGGKIACWAPQTEYLSFQDARQVQFAYDGPMYAIKHQRCEQLSTPDHKMPVREKDGSWGAATVETLAPHRFTIPFTGRRLIGRSCEPDKLRVLIMTQADGHYTNEGDVRYQFKRDRKIERCKHLLRRCGIPFLVERHSNGTTALIVRRRCMPIWLSQFRDKVFGWWMLDESADVILAELQHWDGYRCGPNSVQYSTTIRQNAEVLQAVAVLAGRSATLLTKRSDNPRWRTAYILNIWETPGQGTDIRREQVSTVHHSGAVYCAETKTGFFLVRRNGKVWVTGNSGRLVQVQNLPRTHLQGIDTAREMVKSREVEALRWAYGSVPDTLSQLIRTALVAAPGCTLVDADFSAIEARVIAWLAGEQWVLDVFRGHGRIYEATAAQMFGVPIERIRKGNPEYELRQRGKVATLALGYQGGVGALEAMGALRMGIPEADLPDIVQRWRQANPAIVQLWRDLDSAAVDTIERGTRSYVRGQLVLARERDPAKGLDFLTIQLPSGRKLYYASPTLGQNRWGNPSIQYLGVDQQTRRWTTQETYGGKLAENCVQAIARDCLAEAIERLERAGYPIIMHIHDELVCEVPCEHANLDKVIDIMSQPIPWAPGLPLAADGWVGNYYTKE